MIMNRIALSLSSVEEDGAGFRRLVLTTGGTRPDRRAAQRIRVNT
jgi:hypothetical protein